MNGRNGKNVKKKSPSQEKRDVERTINFKQKNVKSENKEVKVNIHEAKDEKEKVGLKNVETKEEKVGNGWNSLGADKVEKKDTKEVKFVGEFETKDFTDVGHKNFWKLFKNSMKDGIEDIDGSTYNEKFILFWGKTVLKPGLDKTFLLDQKN